MRDYIQVVNRDHRPKFLTFEKIAFLATDKQRNRRTGRMRKGALAVASRA